MIPETLNLESLLSIQIDPDSFLTRQTELESLVALDVPFYSLICRVLPLNSFLQLEEV
jgi:hypothetical protein